MFAYFIKLMSSTAGTHVAPHRRDGPLGLIVKFHLECSRFESMHSKRSNNSKTSVALTIRFGFELGQYFDSHSERVGKPRLKRSRRGRNTR